MNNQNTYVMDTEGKYAIQECVICYNDYTFENGIIFECKHHICLFCYQEMINNFDNLSCPLCRRVIERMPEHAPVELRNIIIIERHNFFKLCLYCFLVVVLLVNILFFAIKV